MSNLIPLERITNSRFNEKNAPFLCHLLEKWQDEKPLKGMRILQNMFNSYETTLKIRCLLAGGADLTITAWHGSLDTMRDEVKQAFKESKINYIPYHRDLSGTFDVALDCGGQLAGLKNISFKAAVELTETGSRVYEQLKQPNYPILDVNNSRLKNFECLFGTGESFVRAFRHLTQQELTHKKVVLFGFGKVGRGITRYLSKHTQDITIVEANPNVLPAIEQQGFKAILNSDLSSKKAALSASDVVVMATGVANVLSSLGIHKSDCDRAFLANMGAEDEFGKNFAKEDVLFTKFPINFSLEEPTLMKYLDPVFYAHNVAILQVLDYSPGYYALPKLMDDEVIRQWQDYHRELIEL